MVASSFKWNYGTACMKLYEYWTLQRIFFEIYSGSNKVAYCILYVLYPVRGVEPVFNGKHLIKKKIYMLHFVLKKNHLNMF